jgi:heme exporter protein D
METAGALGIIEIILIVGCLLWVMNVFRKSSILRKMDQQLDHMNQQQQNQSNNTFNRPKKKVNDRSDEGEFVDYEEVD